MRFYEEGNGLVFASDSGEIKQLYPKGAVGIRVLSSNRLQFFELQNQREIATLLFSEFNNKTGGSYGATLAQVIAAISVFIQKGAVGGGGGITQETDPTISDHIKDIEAGTIDGTILAWNHSLQRYANVNSPLSFVPPNSILVYDEYSTNQGWAYVPYTKLPTGNNPNDTIFWDGANYYPGQLPFPSEHLEGSVLVYNSQNAKYDAITGSNSGDTIAWDGNRFIVVPGMPPTPNHGALYKYDSHAGIYVELTGNGPGDTLYWTGSTWNVVDGPGTEGTYSVSELNSITIDAAGRVVSIQ